MCIVVNTHSKYTEFGFYREWGRACSSGSSNFCVKPPTSDIIVSAMGDPRIRQLIQSRAACKRTSELGSAIAHHDDDEKFLEPNKRQSWYQSVRGNLDTIEYPRPLPGGGFDCTHIVCGFQCAVPIT